VDKEERYATFAQTFIQLPVPQDSYQMSFSTSSVLWCSSDHVASAACLAHKSCGNGMMSFAYKTDGKSNMMIPNLAPLNDNSPQAICRNITSIFYDFTFGCSNNTFIIHFLFASV